MTEKNNLPSENQDFLSNQPDFDDSPTELTYPKTRIRIGLIFAVLGFLLFIVGALPSLFGLDRSRVIGFLQISVFLVGLAMITFGSNLTLNAFWPNGDKTIAADIGSRLSSTGFVICVFTAMADIFGLGSHPLPNVFFGTLQARGMEIGMATIAIGFLLMIRFRRTNGQSKNNHQEAQDSQVSDKPTA